MEGCTLSSNFKPLTLNAQGQILPRERSSLNLDDLHRIWVCSITAVLLKSEMSDGMMKTDIQASTLPASESLNPRGP